MIVLVHKKVRDVVHVYRDSEKIPFSDGICKTLWKVAAEFKDDLIVWVEEDFYQFVRKEKIIESFNHDLIMSSYAIRTNFLSEVIGYVDQLPFINIKSEVKYPTWRMSSDVGGIKGKTLLKFQKIFGDISDFDYLLNSVAKVGQQNGLFCYSDPRLIDAVREKEPRPSAGSKQLLSFIFQHYTTIWTFVLFFCLIKYEKKFPVVAFFQSLLKPKFFKKDINLSNLKIASNKLYDPSGGSVDVIIPTLGRTEYVRQVVKDLSQQSLLPKRIIIVEQQPDKSSGSELRDFLAENWPFKIIHVFTHQIGACNARNVALEHVVSKWVFFADDDIRIESNIVRNTLIELNRIKVPCINLNCKQANEQTFFTNVKQWGSFGAGTSFVESYFAKRVRFSGIFENGYGEDADYGMQLRELGCDIIYHPQLQLLHLKANTGGFREKNQMEWEKSKTLPKPSPTMMAFALRHFTKEQIRGFKVSLFLKFYMKQETKSPFKYIKKMNLKWEESQIWAKKLILANEGKFELEQK